MGTNRERTPLEDQVRKLIRISVGLYLVVAAMVVVLASVLYFSWNANRQRINEQRAIQVATCEAVEAIKTVLRDDKERSLAQSEQFLRENPHGTPGISVGLVRRGIANTRRTLRDLAPTACEAE